MKEIGGRVAIVTGASRGLGRNIAETLFDHGLKLVVTARSADELEAVRAGFDRQGSRSLAIAGDITDEAHRARVVEQAQARFGSLDVLVNNAGNDHPEAFLEVPLDRVRSMFELNVFALIDLTQKALRPMVAAGNGHVVNIASLAGLTPVPYASIYAATKHAIVGFSESLRYEIAGTGVGVSVVCPGFVRDGGLFHDNTGGETSGVQTVSPIQVADAVVKAITGNKDRVLVVPAAARLAPALVGLSPAIIARLAKMTGNYDQMRTIAERLKAEAAPARPATNGATPRRRVKKES